MKVEPDLGESAAESQRSAAASLCRLPDGQLPDGQLPDGQLPDGQLPDGQLPDGQLPDGQLPDLSLSDSQRALVARLADGFTVAEAAALVGCSDRQARRQLRNIWDAMGARNRVQGMVRLALSGLIDRGDVETVKDDGKDRRDIDRDPDTNETTRGDGSP